MDSEEIIIPMVPRVPQVTEVDGNIREVRMFDVQDLQLLRVLGNCKCCDFEKFTSYKSKTFTNLESGDGINNLFLVEAYRKALKVSTISVLILTTTAYTTYHWLLIYNYGQQKAYEIIEQNYGTDEYGKERSCSEEQRALMRVAVIIALCKIVNLRIQPLLKAYKNYGTISMNKAVLEAHKQYLESDAHLEYIPEIKSLNIELEDIWDNLLKRLRIVADTCKKVVVPSAVWEAVA